MVPTIEIGELVDALAVERGDVVSLVGGGGKTTALFALGRQLPGTVVLSTTTKMGSDRTDGHEPLVDPGRQELIEAIASRRVVLTWKDIDDHRALGYGSEECAAWLDLADYVVLEADGSRRKPFKAPAAHEPVVPEVSTLLVACVGASAFDAPIQSVCHRPEIVAEIAGCEPDQLLTAERLAAVLRSDVGSRKQCPANARFSVLLNQVTESHEAFVERLAEGLGVAIPIVSVAPFGPDGR